MHTTAKPTSTDSYGDPERLESAARRMILVGLVLALLGGGAALSLGYLSPVARAVWYHSYLVAFTFYLLIALGGLFFVMLHHLARAGWSVVLRRVAEAIAGNLGLMALLFIPLLFGLHTLYEWSHPEAVAHDPVIAAKASYLNPTAFVVRFVVLFVVLGGLTYFLRSRSLRQDAIGDLRLSHGMELASALGMILFAVLSTLAAIDLLMSLNPHWFSTMIGVYFFTDAVLGGLAVLVLLTIWLQRNGQIAPAVNQEHYHDLGKLLFAFVVFWGYIAFSQYMLIWYANMPEETQFYQPRQLGPWAVVSLVLLACHLFIPMAGLLSRHVKRSPKLLALWAAWLLAAQLLDVFWLVMPNFFIQQIPSVADQPNVPESMHRLVDAKVSVYQLVPSQQGFMEQVWLPLEWPSIGLVLAWTVAIGGLFLAHTVWLLRRAPLVPAGDPRLAESLHFENI